MSPRLLGTVVEKDGWICLQTSACAWYPLGGASGIAFDFRGAFGTAQKGDIGKRVYRYGDVLQMENTEQRDKRLAKESTK